MQQDETSQCDATNPGPLLAPAALDAWLRERLGRQMVVAVVAAGAQPESALARIEQGVGRYGEVRLLGRIVTLDRDDAQLAALIAALAPLDPDAMLIVSTTITDASGMCGRWPPASGQGCATAPSSRCSRQARACAPRRGR